MNEFVETFDMSQLVDKYVERVSRNIDAEVLERVESELAGYGYVKVVRCRDCQHYREKFNGCAEFGDEWHRRYSIVDPNGFCYWAKRKEGGE